MLSTALTAVLGIAFVQIGVVALWLIFKASRHSQDQAARSRRIQAHRIAGYLFIALFGLDDMAYAAETQGRVR